MPRTSGLIALVCAVTVSGPTSVAAQGSHVLEYHALFPGRQSGDVLDCSAGESAFDPLRAGRTLRLIDDAGADVGSAVLEDVASSSSDGLCETSVIFVDVPDAAAYSVLAGDQAIASRDKADLEAAGWVMRSQYGTRSESTPAPSPAHAPVTSAGPVVLGGRIEVPSASFALEVPEGWYAFDLSAPDLMAEMETFDETAAMLIPTVEALRLENLRPDIAAAEPLVAMPLWALAPLDGPTAGELCTVLVEPFDSDSLGEFVDALLVGMQEEMDSPDESAFEYVDLPAGPAAMLERSGVTPVGFEAEMTAFSLLHDDWGYTFECTHFTRRADRWLSIAETFEFLPGP